MSNDHLLKNFNTFITQLEGGALNEELSELVRKCVGEISDACLDRGGSHTASLTLKLDFSMNHKDKIVEIEAKVDSKYPKAPRGRAGMFFCDRDGNLTRENPRQLDMIDDLKIRRDQNTMARAGVVNGDVD